MWIESNGNPIFSETGVFLGYRGTSRDITKRKNDEDRIAFMAHHDALTGLPNRQLFMERMEQALASAGAGQGFAVLLLDLDFFKVVNDTLGHPVGDLLLRAVAQRLSLSVHDIDTVARLGGDEFAIVLASAEGPEQASSIAQRLVDSVGQPLDLDGHRVTVGVTIGIAIASADRTNGDQLLRYADIALYAAKVEEPGSWRFFEPAMEARLEARRSLGIEIRKALSHNEFELGYLPIRNSRSGQISAFEAILRWRHAERGTIEQADFLSIAEETGMSVAIGEQMLHKAFLEAKSWPADVSLAVSLSPLQLRNRRAVAIVREALFASGCPASKLELQITEAALAHNGAATVATLNQLRELGARISLNDFGAGESSLRYVRSFPFDNIKINRSVLHGPAEKPAVDPIFHGLLNLSAGLGNAGSDEDVEPQGQCFVLRADGCMEVRGRSFGPMTAEDVAAMLRDSRVRAPDFAGIS